MRLNLGDRRFLRSKQAHAPAGTPEGRAVARILRELEAADDLPGPDDIEENIPPALPCLARRIPSARLLVCYRVRDGVVYPVAVKREVD